jgi:hypothetical protein
MSEFFVYPEDMSDVEDEDETKLDAYHGDRAVISLTIGIPTTSEKSQQTEFESLGNTLIKQITNASYGVTYDWKKGTWISEKGWDKSKVFASDGIIRDLEYYEEDITLEISISVYEKDYDKFEKLIQKMVSSTFKGSMLPIQNVQLLRSMAISSHFIIDTS